MKHAHNFYPSHIAKILAHEAGLLSDMQTDFIQADSELSSEVDRLIEFQQMSLVASFEDCLIVYFENNLSEEQIEKLKIIYEVTPQLLPGTIFEETMSRIADERRSLKPNMTVIANSLHTAINILTTKRRVAQ